VHGHHHHFFKVDDVLKCQRNNYNPTRTHNALVRYIKRTEVDIKNNGHKHPGFFATDNTRSLNALEGYNAYIEQHASIFNLKDKKTNNTIFDATNVLKSSSVLSKHIETAHIKEPASEITNIITTTSFMFAAYTVALNTTKLLVTEPVTPEHMYPILIFTSATFFITRTPYYDKISKPLFYNDNYKVYDTFEKLEEYKEAKTFLRTTKHTERTRIIIHSLYALTELKFYFLYRPFDATMFTIMVFTLFISVAQYIRILTQ